MTPTSIIAAKLKIKRYVGIAKIEPASRMPRRLPSVISPIKIRLKITFKLKNGGKTDVIAVIFMPAAFSADVTAKEPAAIETATVIT